MAIEGQNARTEEPVASTGSPDDQPWPAHALEEYRTGGVRAPRHRLWTWSWRQAVRIVRRFNFWLAIALPLVYIPLLLVGIPPELGLPGVGGLIVLNAIAVLLGHGGE